MGPTEICQFLNSGDDLQVDDGGPAEDRQQAGRVLLAAVQGQQEALLQVKKD